MESMGFTLKKWSYEFLCKEPTNTHLKANGQPRAEGYQGIGKWQGLSRCSFTAMPSGFHEHRLKGLPYPINRAFKMIKYLEEDKNELDMSCSVQCLSRS